MKFQEFKEKFKVIVEICGDFVFKYKRYFLGGCIFIIMALVLFLGTTPKSDTEKNVSGASKKYKENNNTELDILINSYYTAYALGDTDSLQTIAQPYCDREIEYIKFFSQYIDNYEDIKIYTKPGLNEGDYLVTTEFAFKFVDIDTPAPGLGFFYVQTNEDGNLYINNAFAPFNEENDVYARDPEISDLYAVFIKQQDLNEKRNEVADKYQDALESDPNLKFFMDETLPAATITWNEEYEAQVAAAEQEAAEAAAQAEKEAAEQAEAEAKAAAEAEEETNAFSGKVTSKVNVREKADKNSNKLGSLDKNTTIKIYAEEGDFYKFDYNGTRAYVAKSVVKLDEAGDNTEDTTETEETTTADSIASGTEVTLSSTVNIRSQMDSSSSKVAVAYAGEKVTVVMSYAEGWTKVKYNKKEGYVRTDLLQ